MLIGLCLTYRNKEENEDEEEKKPKTRALSGECLPLRFIAQQIADFVRAKIVEPNRSKYSDDILKDKVIMRCLMTYIEVSDMLKDIRYNQKDAIQSIYGMVRALTNTELMDITSEACSS